MAIQQKYPAYLELHRRGELAKRAECGRDLLAACRVCPRECGVNRLKGETGYCGIGAMARVASHGPHFGEERPLVGSTGSGAIFFEGCSLGCVFCQNETISRVAVPGDGHRNAVAPQQLAAVMLELQQRGCLNVNLVTPTHVVPQILYALVLGADRGLRLPLVYNSSGYESLETLQLLNGVVDIYLPDCKFLLPEHAQQYTGVADYPRQMKAALREMHDQVGDLLLDDNRRALQGLLVRHLVMPGCLEDWTRIADFLVREISPHTYVNLMDQYHPCCRAGEFEAICRPLRRLEFQQAMDLALAAGLHRLEQQDIGNILEQLLAQRP